ncbi:MAG TPA: twin-arginine translocase subunit TatC [Acidimicrobiales bacterium]|nr:twin-arginine translocase subunit TatC [Acidimicrobiales bacterium]
MGISAMLNGGQKTERPVTQMMSLHAHLAELRSRLMVCVGAFASAMVIAYLLYGEVLSFLERPYCATIGRADTCALYVTGPLDAFAVRMNVTAYGALILSSPVIFYELWNFVTPGLRASERRYALPFVAAMSMLFLTGSFVAWTTFPHVMSFLHGVGGPGIRDIFTPDRYIGLICSLMAIFGLVFEFPVLLVSLEIAGVVTPARLGSLRRMAIVAIVVLSAVITPSSDPFSMLAMALPMLVFYEVSILIGRIFERRRR